MTNEINVNQDVVLLPSFTAAYSTPDVSVDQENPYWASCVIYINISQASGTGGLTLNVQFKDPVSGNYVTAFTAAAALNSVGLFAYVMGQATNWMNGPNIKGDVSGSLPRTWRAQITKGDASSYTYSVGCSMTK